MVRGLYAAAAGIRTQIAKNDVYAANLANVSTAGYRRSRISQESFSPVLAAVQNPNEPLRSGLAVSSGGLDLTPGPISQSGSDFDLAIVGQGFFCVRTPAGDSFTRNGQFQLDANNIVVTRDNYPLLGAKGPIRIASGSMSVDERGQVWDGEQLVDGLRIVEFPDPAGLSKAAAGLILGTGQRPADNYKIMQGAVEGSNVEAMTELQRMMNGLRLYEANVRVLQAHDESIGVLLREAAG